MDQRDWDDRYASTDLVWSAEPNRFVQDEVAGLAPGRALDLAAGEGRNAIFLASTGWKVTAVDFSEVALDKGRRLADGLGDPAAAARIEWVVADLLAYAPEPSAFDLVVLCYLQLPAPERATVLRAATGALAPGGTLLVVGHALANLAEGTGGPQDPAVLYEPADVVDAFPPDAGLVVERADHVKRPIEGQRDAIDTLVRARRPV